VSVGGNRAFAHFPLHFFAIGVAPPVLGNAPKSVVESGQSSATQLPSHRQTSRGCPDASNRYCRHVGLLTQWAEKTFWATRSCPIQFHDDCHAVSQESSAQGSQVEGSLESE